MGASFMGVISGFFCGAGVAILFFVIPLLPFIPRIRFLEAHLQATGLGMAMGIAGAIILWRQKGPRILCLVLPAAAALLGSVATVLLKSGSGLNNFTWFGTSAALGGAVTGLLMGFASRRTAGYIGGFLGGQLGAWPAAVAYIYIEGSLPSGFVFAVAYMFVAGLTLLSISFGLKVFKVEVQPPRSKS